MIKKLRIGSLELPAPLILAPMAGISHHPFRKAIANLGGCGLFVSEMQPVKAAVNEAFDTSFYLYFSDAERPFFYQISGSDGASVARCIRYLERFNPDGFDINMGCPHPRVTSKGCGIALMKDIVATATIVSAARNATTRPLTAKIRLGINEENSEYLSDFCQMLTDCGIDAITVHGRLGRDRRRKSVQWQSIAAIKKRVSVPLIGNGDIESIADIKRAFEVSGCDGVMIGRGAVQRPWLFNAFQRPETPVSIVDIYEKLITDIEQFFPEERRLGRLKEITSYYSVNFSFGHHWRSAVQGSQTFASAIAVSRDFFTRNTASFHLPNT